MCGICGILPKPRPRTEEEWNLLRGLFTGLLVANEVRGPYATGVATMALDGSHRLVKRAVAARTLIQDAGFAKTLAGIGEDTTVVMGHTRWPTVGDLNAPNNQPIRCVHVLGTHNGHIGNHAEVAEKFALARNGQVDSEVLFRLVEAQHKRRGWLGRTVETLSHVEGTFASVLVSRKTPHQVLLLRRGKPLALGWLPEVEALVYTSDILHLSAALAGLEWRRVLLREGQAARINVNHLPKLHRRRLAPPPTPAPASEPWALPLWSTIP